MVIIINMVKVMEYLLTISWKLSPILKGLFINFSICPLSSATSLGQSGRHNKSLSESAETNGG